LVVGFLGLGFGVWGRAPHPQPQNPNPQSPIPNLIDLIFVIDEKIKIL